MMEQALLRRTIFARGREDSCAHWDCRVGLKDVLRRAEYGAAFGGGGDDISELVWQGAS